MGTKHSKNRAEKKLDQVLDSRLRRESREKIYTLLILGANKSGKSTLLNQLNILFGKGFTNEYRIEIKIKMYSYIIESMQQILKCLKYYSGRFTLNFHDESVKKSLKLIKDLNSNNINENMKFYTLFIKQKV